MRQAPFDELNIIRERVNGYLQSPVSKQTITEIIQDDFLEFLMDAAEAGYQDALEMLGWTEDTPLLDTGEIVMQKIAEKDMFQRVSEYVESGDLDALMKVAETECERDYNQTAYVVAKEFQNSNPESSVMKRWVSMRDERVRDTHFGLDGVEIHLDDWFTTYKGDMAQHPGGFGIPEEDINCRCWLNYSISP